MTKFIDENKLVEHREQLHNADKKKMKTNLLN